MKLQKTIKTEVRLPAGKGLFGGQDVKVTFRPAADNSGVVFVRNESRCYDGHLESGAVHPGLGVGQGESSDRYAIARYTVGTDGNYSIGNSVAAHTGCIWTNGIEVVVLANDTIVSSTVIDNAATSAFDTALGSLNNGDTIAVAIGPNGSDGCDGATIDWNILLSQP